MTSQNDPGNSDDFNQLFMVMLSNVTPYKANLVVLIFKGIAQNIRTDDYCWELFVSQAFSYTLQNRGLQAVVEKSYNSYVLYKDQTFPI